MRRHWSTGACCAERERERERERESESEREREREREEFGQFFLRLLRSSTFSKH